MNLFDLAVYFLTGLGFGIIIGLFLYASDVSDDRLLPLIIGILIGSCLVIIKFAFPENNTSCLFNEDDNNE
jgi:hypothetical protein